MQILIPLGLNFGYSQLWLQRELLLLLELELEAIATHSSFMKMCNHSMVEWQSQSVSRATSRFVKHQMFAAKATKTASSL